MRMSLFRNLTAGMQRYFECSVKYTIFVIELYFYRNLIDLFD